MIMWGILNDWRWRRHGGDRAAVDDWGTREVRLQRML